MTETIAFIGLGNMGGPMAANGQGRSSRPGFPTLSSIQVGSRGERCRDQPHRYRCNRRRQHRHPRCPLAST